MSIIPEPTAPPPDVPASSVALPASRSMGDSSRVAMIVALSLACVVTLRGSNYLLGAILGVPWQFGIPLVPGVAALVWLVPLFVFPSLRDVGSFQLSRTWTVLLLLPVVALNWTFSFFLIALPVWLPWIVWLHQFGGGMATGVFEELIFRGYAFRRVPGAHPRLVVVTTALCFALIHFMWLLERPLSAVLPNVVFALVVGLALSIIRMISGSLAWCMLLHGAINAAHAAALPGLNRWTPCVLAAVAIASITTICRHRVFRNRTPQSLTF